MRKTTVNVQADSSSEAVRKASLALGVSTGNIYAEEVSPKHFVATIRNADAEVEISIRSNGMEAVLAKYEPPIGDGLDLSDTQILLALQKAGVVIDPDYEQIKAALLKIEEKESPEGIVLARGKLPHGEQKATLLPKGDLNAPVFPGSVFAEIQTPKSGEPGMTVTGQTITAQSGGSGFALELDAHCRQEGSVLKSMIYGLATVRKSGVSIKPLAEVAPDHFHVFGTIYPEDSNADSVSMNRIADVLRQLNIVAPLHEEEVSDAIVKAAASGQPQVNVLLAKGIEAIDGEDGRLELRFQTELSVGTENEAGKVDFRERGAVHSVAAGELLGTLIPPTAGTEGMDVYGTSLQPKAGKAADMHAGENVNLSEDGTRFFAEADGMVVLTDSKISVSEVFEVKGDVDYTVGNIRMEKGSVHIGGTVRTGFEVYAAGNVVVDQAIEGAKVEAGGNVQVGHGIVMHEDGLVKAGGTITAHFAENAKLEAGANIVIDNDMSACHAFAKGKVLVFEGKGRIQGGHVHAGLGITANETGSNLNVHTPLIVGLEPEGRAELLEERSNLEAMVRKIDSVVGKGDIRTILERTPAVKRKAIAELLKARISILRKLDDVESGLREITEKVQRSTKSRVRVFKVAHPETTIEIGHATYVVKEPIKSCQFYYHPRKGDIRIASVSDAK